MQAIAVLCALMLAPALQGTQSIRIEGIIDDDTVTDVLNVMEKLPAEVRVVINSPGGSVTSANAITNVFMFARANGVKVRCLVDGRAMSAAFWILESCGERMATPQSKMMTHSPYIIARGEIVLTLEILEKFLAELTQDDRQLAAVVAPRLGMTPEAFRAKLKEVGLEGWRFDAPEALNLHALDSLFMGDTNTFVPRLPKSKDLTASADI